MSGLRDLLGLLAAAAVAGLIGWAAERYERRAR